MKKALFLVSLLYLGWRAARRLPPERKGDVAKLVNRVFGAGERVGLVKPNPGFRTDYLADYPELEILERNHRVIQDECLALLEAKSHLVDVQALGDSYTTGGIHTIAWKSFMFKSGEFIEENCARAPRTAALLRTIPGVYTAFFSILDPKQHVRRTGGYYKGFLRYHLGVVVPAGENGRACFLRINDDPVDNAAGDRTLVERGEKYFWREGEGVLFDDTFLHDAANESDEVRVVLWLDLARRMRPPLGELNRLFLWVAHRDPTVREIRRNAVVTLPGAVPAEAELSAVSQAQPV
jgi:ornithine lipid ester-linked acyl 2-hydroxylase